MLSDKQWKEVAARLARERHKTYRIALHHRIQEQKIKLAEGVHFKAEEGRRRDERLEYAQRLFKWAESIVNDPIAGDFFESYGGRPVGVWNFWQGLAIDGEGRWWEIFKPSPSAGVRPKQVLLDTPQKLHENFKTDLLEAVVEYLETGRFWERMVQRELSWPDGDSK